jgi:hypothetical protein
MINDKKIQWFKEDEVVLSIIKISKGCRIR